MPDAVTTAEPLPLVHPATEVVVVCRSAPAMVDFYTRVLGFRERTLVGRPGAGIYRLTLGRSVLQLADAGKRVPDNDGGGVGLAELTVAVHDIDEVLGRALARGAEETVDGVTVWRATDPDGNALRVMAGDGLTESACRLHVSLAAADPAATLDFYRRRLRLPEATAGDPLLADDEGVLAGDMRIGVRPAPQGASPFADGPWAAAGLRYLVGFVHDAPALHATFSGRDIRPVMDLRNDGSKDAFAVADPDGTWFEFVSLSGKDSR
ncbi:MAG TPA: VOC family protein [Acidimicrobiales bacterium]|nr:VOC family protein [Acidimicrobiales bacterium]